MTVSIAAAARGEWQQHGTYLNTATFGLPPRRAYDAIVAALDDWRTGRTSEDAWEASTERARALFAHLVHVNPENVVCGATVSELNGLVAASLPDGARVLVADNDFASTLFPYTVHERRGVIVDSVPLAQLLDRISPRYALVAVSHVQAATGEVVALPQLLERCATTGVQLCLDATQACGWLETDAARADYYICHAYKWLAATRGAAFMAVRPDRANGLRPLHAGWWSTDDPNNNLFGLPNRISKTARRFDTSPAWFSWVGAEQSLAAIAEIGVPAIQAHDMALARRFCAGMRLPDPVSPIVYLESATDFETLLRAGIRASVRAGRMRLSFHLYNTEADVDRVLGLLR